MTDADFIRLMKLPKPDLIALLATSDRTLDAHASIVAKKDKELAGYQKAMIERDCIIRESESLQAGLQETVEDLKKQLASVGGD